MITKKLIEQCLDYFSAHQPSCDNYINASQLWEDSGHSVAAMLEHEDAEHWRFYAAYLVPDLSRSRRWELVRDIRDEYWRCFAACFVPGLTDNQRAELREGK